MTPTAVPIPDPSATMGDALSLVWGVAFAIAALAGLVVALRHLVQDMSADRCEELRLRLEHERLMEASPVSIARREAISAAEVDKMAHRRSRDAEMFGAGFIRCAWCDGTGGTEVVDGGKITQCKKCDTLGWRKIMLAQD